MNADGIGPPMDAASDSDFQRRRLTLNDVCREPFRIFFPSAVVAGLLGVAQWPLHFGGYIEFYPGMAHSRLMAFGFFGGFIAGFLGTAGPRLMSARPWNVVELGVAFVLYWTVTGCLLAGRLVEAEMALIAWLVWLGILGALRLWRREDLPPPGFVLIPLAFLCAIGGAVISLLEPRRELDLFWLSLRPLISFQGFACCCRCWASAPFCCRVFLSCRRAIPLKNPGRLRRDGCGSPPRLCWPVC